MRQDEKDQPRAPIDTAAFVTQMKAAGVNRLITIDVHNKGAMQNACAVAKLHFDHLEARCLLAAEAIRGIPEGRRVVAAAPDVGASKRATPMFQETLSRLLKRRVGFAIVRKIRIGDTATKVTTLIEDPDFPIGPRPGHGPEDAAYILCQDDILATGGTIKDCKKITEERGGIFHAACYTNGLFTGNAQSNLAGIPLIGTDVCSLWRVENTPIYEQIRTIDTSPLFARAIMETHLNGSINQLLSALEPR
jgi:ribose-phosphate pyrophosphokinase